MPISAVSTAAADTPQDRSLRLGDVDALVREHPAFSTPAARALIHRAKDNGLAEHIYRVGRRAYIDLNGFQEWVRARGKHQAGGAA